MLLAIFNRGKLHGNLKKIGIINWVKGCLYMKKYRYLVVFLVVGLAMSQVALGENLTEYIVVSPLIGYINIGSDDARSLNSTLYVSEDEIWYSGYAFPSGSWLIQANSKGEIVSRTTFPDAPSNNPIIHCIAKVGDTLMLGFIDAETQAGSIGLMPSAGGKTSYCPLQIDEKAMTMVRTPSGIFSLSVVYNEKQNTSTLRATHVTFSEGFSFQQTVHTTDMTVDSHMLSSSKGCAADDRYYVQVNSGVTGRVQPQKELICFGTDGSEQWKIILPENISVQRMSASGGNLYLFGMTGVLDENDILINHKATVICYSNDSTQKWEKTFDAPEEFCYGTSNNDLCIAASGIEGVGTWNVCTITADGIVTNMTRVDFFEDMFIRGVFESFDGHVKALGTTLTQLFVFQTQN